MLGLGLLGLGALWLSAWPRAALAVPVVLAGLSLRRLQRLPRGQLLMHASGQAEWWPARPTGAAMSEPSAAELLGLESRGPLAVLRVRVQGRVVRWPLASDTLPSAQARLLRLWIDRHLRAAQDPPPTPSLR